MFKLLIVDDQTTLLSALQHALEDEYDVRCAQSGEEALGIIPAWQPDVVITDYEMEGMTGLDLIGEIVNMEKPLGGQENQEGTACRAPTQIKKILISAKMDWELKQRAMAYGADLCLTKPFDLWELQGCLRRLLSE